LKCDLVHVCYSDWRIQRLEKRYGAWQAEAYNGGLGA